MAEHQPSSQITTLKRDTEKKVHRPFEISRIVRRDKPKTVVGPRSLAPPPRLLDAQTTPWLFSKTLIGQSRSRQTRFAAPFSSPTRHAHGLLAVDSCALALCLIFEPLTPARPRRALQLTTAARHHHRHRQPLKA